MVYILMQVMYSWGHFLNIHGGTVRISVLQWVYIMFLYFKLKKEKILFKKLKRTKEFWNTWQLAGVCVPWTQLLRARPYLTNGLTVALVTQDTSDATGTTGNSNTAGDASPEHRSEPHPSSDPMRSQPPLYPKILYLENSKHISHYISSP